MDMTVAQLIDELAKLPEDAVVLIEGDAGLSSIGSLEFVAARGPGAPAEVILLPSMDE